MPFIFNELEREKKGIKHDFPTWKWNDLSEDERKREFEIQEQIGFVAPRKDGFFTELGQGAAYGGLGALKGLGSTLEEATGYSGMKEYFGDVMRQNQQYNPSPDYKALSLDPANIARTIGSGAAQSTLALGGAVAGGILGGGVGGVAASTAMMFGQIYGDRVQEYRDAFPNQDEGTVKGLAFLSSLGESLIESVIGPEQLATGIAKKWATGALKETTKGFVKTAGKEALKNFLTEGSEEVAQDYWDRICRSALDERGIQLPSWEEVGETFMGGAWSGLALGAAGGAVESMGSRNAAPTPTAATPVATPAAPTVPPATPVAETPSDESMRKTKLTLADQVAKEIGIKVRYFDEMKMRDKDTDISDGWYDEKSGEIWLDRENPNADVLKNLGHEFKHYLDDKQKGLIQKFNDLFNAGINEAGNARAAEIEDRYQREAGQVGRGFDELSADTFGEMWTDPDFWRDVATRAEKMEAGMGQKFIDTLNEFIKIVKAKLKKIGTPEAKQLFDNMNELRDEAVNILAEIKRQNGTSTEEENVVGANGSTDVVSVPVKDIQLDPERFQFKSNTNKKTGVDESNLIGGEWDPKSAGILYLWEDKNGNKFVVNGHHRLELAKRKGVENLNAIIDREADGVSAEDARKNGILINIRDEQGEVRDYADFVRSAKLDEATAEKEGVLSRKKGKAGFNIGHYASDNLYATYRNGDVTDAQAAAIADVARGDTGLENAGIRAAKNGMKKVQLVEHLKFLKANSDLRQKNEETGDLFGGFDDSALKLSEELSAKALEHIDGLKKLINSAKSAIKNPAEAKKLGVSVGKEAQNLLDRTKQELQDWENWQTNKKLRDQLLREIEKEMPEAEAKAVETKAEAPKAEEKTEEQKNENPDEGRFNPDSETPLLTPEEDANDFTLIGQTPEEAKADEKAAEQREAEARERADQQSKRETPELFEEKPTQPAASSEWGANNTIVSRDAYEKAKKKVQESLRRTNMGIDPEILSNGAIVAAYHIEAGARKFADFAKHMISDLGDAIKPYLKGLYENARRFPGMENIAKDMDSTEFVDKYNFDETKPAPEPAPQTNVRPSEDEIRKELHDVIMSDGDARSKATQLSRLAKAWNMSLKEVQERCEAEVVEIAREIDSLYYMDDARKYKNIVSLYNNQPTFSNRTSTSMINQAYSTPAPLAWILGKRIGLNGNTVYEPTAGTGMLTIAGDPSTIHVNEINPLRSEILNRQGFMLNTSNDASKTRPNKKYDRVIMNPPFDSATPVMFGDYKLSKLDHIIAARALEAMKPDGRAAIIVGANTDGHNGEGRATLPDHIFMNYLYSNYNVKDNFIVSGPLYAKQGASYPVRVITIDGKRAESIEGKHPTDIEKIDNWDTLYNRLQGELGNGTENVPESGRSDNGNRNESSPDVRPRESEQSPENAQRNPERTTGALDEGGSVSAGRREENRGNPAEQRTGSTRGNGSGSVRGQLVSESNQSERSGQRINGNGTESVSGRDTDVVRQQDNASGVRAEQSGTEQSGRSGVANVGSVPGAPVRSGGLKVGEKRGELNNAYNSASDGPKMDVVVPSFLARETEESLQRLESEVGNVDDYVKNELGYDSKDELYECLSDAQIDSVAMAIKSLKNREGFIIGDQTGIGKGRQCAAIMRWAVKNGQIPIFFTKDPKLFSDMYAGDLPDIHTKLNPIVIGDSQKAKIVDSDGNVLRKVTPNLESAFKSILSDKGEYDSVFIPYSQINKKDNKQQTLLRDLIVSKKCVLILDEAHEAAGAESNIGTFFSGKGGVLFDDVGVVYSSATFAKRPDTMGLYAIRTKIKDAIGGNTDRLTDVLKRGGVALQQIISKGVAAVGQYIRRERDFSGVTFDVKIDEQNRADVEERYDRVAHVLGQLVKHSSLIRKTVNKAERSNYGSANTNEKSRIETSSFGSVCHNYINQLLLASKADIVVDNALQAFQRGQKPVIAVDNTMESALKNYCEDNGIKPGDPVRMTFSSILENALSRMYSYTVKEGKKGEKIRIEFSPAQYGLEEAHERMLKIIHELDDIRLPISPIDYIKDELEKRGVKVGELTGRELGIDYSTEEPTLYVRDTKNKDKNKNVNDFNSGKTDAIILNRSGSTGLSLHASKKFKDQKQRHMIMGQPSLDIAIVQQTFGRVLRSGQVTNPEYTILSSFLASERRVMMVLSRKLQSLNANTTANNKGSVNLGVDFLNKYGDEVAEEFLTENPEIEDALDLDVNSDAGNEELMRKLTGKMAILPNDQQEKIYDELIERYKNKIDFLKKTGNYDLEMTVHEDWDVITNSEEELVPGNKNGTIFDQPVTMKQISVKEQKKIRDAAEVQAEIDKNLGRTREEVARKLDDDLKTVEKDIESLETQYIGGDWEPDRIMERKHLLRDAVRRFKNIIQYTANRMLEIQIADDSYTGIITGWHTIGSYSPKSPFVPSKTIIDIAVADSVGKLSIPLSKFVGKDITYSLSTLGINDAFTGENRSIRTNMYAFTGNLLRAIELAERGKVVSYKTNDGKVENALLMPKNWTAQAMRDPRREFKTPQDVVNNIPEGAFSLAYEGAALRNYGDGQFRLSLPKTRGKGKDARFVKDKDLIAITGDFVSYGQRMTTDVISKDKARRAVDYLMKNGVVFKMPENTDGRRYSLREEVTANASPETVSAEENTRHFHLVDDPKLIKKLDNEEYITTYRAAQLVDGKLYPPMAAKVNGKWGPEIQLGKWEESDERPDKAFLKNGRWWFKLNKGNGKTIDARYNPYIHSSPTPLNDQFSSAYDRPNLVTLEVRVPKSELTSGYKADKAKDAVGMLEWKAGTVQGKLSGTRKVMLSRWDKPMRIVPDSEVAKMIYDMVRGQVNDLPSNVLSPSLRAELEKLGVPIAEMERHGKNYYRKGTNRKYHLPTQVNPIREDGEIKDEYADILENTEYTPKSNAELNKQAERRIAGFGGVQGVIDAVLNDDFKLNSDVSQRMMQTVLNSGEFKVLDQTKRRKVADLYIKNLGTEVGRALAARRLGVLNMEDIESIQAHVNALLAKMDKETIDKLRKDVFDEFGIDIDKLPDDIVKDPRKLDEMLRKLVARRASIPDKLYEYWINAILSSPTTHAANAIGNTANAAYELGLKRLAEATINIFMRKKDAATFGEFKEMTNAVNWGEALRRAKFMFDVETLTGSGKLDRANAAIGGKLGRAIRVPGRLLRAADEFAKAVVQPMEAAAYAYRQAKAAGMNMEATRGFILSELEDEESDANAYGRKRALDLTFQEKPYQAIQQLISWRESGGVMGTMMKFFLPFIKTPSNILRQGVRKSPLGAANLAWQTVQGFRGKRQFDNEYIALVAEQLLAWGAVMMLAGSGDDDEPFITGSSPKYGSAEQKFKQNKVPPYSIRIGDNYYSYQRIEPLATGLAFIADGIEAYKSAKRGEEGTAIMRRLIGKTTRLVAEKSFLDSIGEIQKFVEDPERSGTRWISNFAASWMPNAVRTVRNNIMDDAIRDNKNRERGKKWFEEQFNVITSAAGITKAAPKRDYFGRIISRDSLSDAGGLWQWMRMIPIRSISPAENMNKAERLIWTYNQKNPDKEYYPDVPAYYFTRDGQKLYMTGKNYDEFVEKSGQLALKQINNAFRHGLLNERKPTEKDIDLIKKIFQRARKEVRDDFYKRKKYTR